MRRLFAGIFLFLIASLCMAQTESQVGPSRDSGTLFQATPSTPRNVFKFYPLPLFSSQPGKNVTVHFEDSTMPEAGCFTMRTYFFSKSTIGSAPKMTGYTTCVPSRRLELRQAAPPVRFVPQ